MGCFLQNMLLLDQSDLSIVLVILDFVPSKLQKENWLADITRETE